MYVCLSIYIYMCINRRLLIGARVFFNQGFLLLFVFGITIFIFFWRCTLALRVYLCVSARSCKRYTECFCLCVCASLRASSSFSINFQLDSIQKSTESSLEASSSSSFSINFQLHSNQKSIRIISGGLLLLFY